MKKIPLLFLAILIFSLFAKIDCEGQVKISAMPETKEDPAGGWIPVVLSNKNYKYNPGSYVQQKTIENIRGISPTNLPVNYVYYVTDLGKEGFFRYDNADAASVDDGATVLVTKNNLRFKRIIENNKVSAKWFEMGTNPGAIINTLVYRNNAVVNYAQAQAIFDYECANSPQNCGGHNSRVKLSNTDFTSQNATWFALQRAINFCLLTGHKLYIPAGHYIVSKGLLVAPLPNGFAGGVEIEGAATAYNGGSSQTLLQFTDKNSFGLGLHRVKGARVRNLFIMGQNKIGLEEGRNTLYDWFENPNMDWSGGCRTVLVSPHAGFIVDPLFNEGAGGEEHKYPGFESVYSDPSWSGGSTDVIFDNCRSDYFVVGYCFSPHGAPQNGDNIAVNNSWVNYCMSGISVGQSQNRNVSINNLKCWGGVEYLFDSQRFADGMADHVDVDQLQIAGGVKFLSRNSSWRHKGLQIRRMHAESLLSLGGGGGADMVIVDSFITLIGDWPSERVHAARSAFTGYNLVVRDSFFGMYQGSNTMPLVINSGYSRFENCQLDGGVVNVGSANLPAMQHDIIGQYRRGRYTQAVSLVPWNPIPFFKEDDEIQIPRSYGNYKRVARNSLPPYIFNKYAFLINQPIILSSIDEVAMEAVFSLPVATSDFKSLVVGDPILSSDQVPSELGEVGPPFLMGRVKSKDVNSGSITLELIGKGLNTSTSYNGTVFRETVMIPSFIMGTTTNESNVITNVFQETGQLYDWSGYMIVSPYFPPGTTIVSVDTNAKTFTMSNNATASVNGIEVICADWTATEYGSGPHVNWTPYGYSAYKKDDIIYNTDIVNFPDVEKWVCVKSGFLGQPDTAPYVAEFNTYFKNTSKTLTANGTLEIAAGRLVSTIIVRPKTALTAFKIGTTLNGNNVLAATSVAANTDRIININRYFRDKTTLYVSGITGSVEIIIPK